MKSNLHQRLTPAHIGPSNNQNLKPTKGTWIKVKEQQSDDNRGAYCVADKDISIGDVLLKETPFIRHLDPKYCSSHCSYCFKYLFLDRLEGEDDYSDEESIDEEEMKEMERSFKKELNIEDDSDEDEDGEDYRYVHCRESGCKWNVRYCSTMCEQEAWSTSHQWLCRFPELENEDQDVLFAIKGYFKSHQGRNTYALPDLVSNRDKASSDEVELYRKKLKSIAAAFCLEERAIESIIDIIYQIRCNTFAVKATESNPVDGRIMSRDFVTLGRAVYLSASKLNHDCEPNAIASFDKSFGNNCTIVITCTKGPIKKGQEVSISYGPLASQHNREERRRKLKQGYSFECNCKACQQKSEDSPDCMYKCMFCSTGKLYRMQTKCNHCGNEPNWSRYLKTEAEIERLTEMEQFHLVGPLEQTIYHKYALPLGKTADRLAMYACQEGDWSGACLFSMVSMQVAQKVYGKISVEAAEEMMKYSTILLNACHNKAKNATPQQALSQIKQTMVVYKILGLDKSLPEDIEELQDAQDSLTVMTLWNM